MNEATQFLIRHGYSILFIWVLLEKLGVPIPVVPALLAAGTLAGLGKLNFALVIVMAVIASLSGDLLWYYLGRLYGNKVLSLLCRISLDPDSCVRRVKGIYTRYGARALLVARFFPGLSTIGAPLAGVIRMRVRDFIMFDGIGTLCWVGVLAGLGYQFNQLIEHLFTDLFRSRHWIGWMIPMSFAIYVLWKYIQRKRFLHQIAVARVTPEEVKQKLDEGEKILILDLRSALEFDSEPYTIPGAFHLSFDELEENHQKLPRDREVILFCA